MIDPTLAANAYASSSGIKTSGVPNAASLDDGGVKFSDFLKDKAQDSMDTLRAGEVMSAKAVTGEADLLDVVGAVSSAELTLQTIVSLRDRMISAYQEIMRMPI